MNGSSSSGNGSVHAASSRNGAAHGTRPSPPSLTTAADLGGCHWIPWDAPWVAALPDPTRAFSLVCLVIITGVFLYMNHGDVAAVVWGLYLNPYVLLFFATAVATWYHAAVKVRESPQLATVPVYDAWTAEWYWWNSWLFHATMDGSAGALRLVPVVVQQYDIMDLRFPTRHAVPWMIGLIELVCMYPLCLATYHAVVTKSPHRYALELVTSSMQFMGMVIFIVTEVYEGQVNVPALDPVGNQHDGTLQLRYNLYHLVYYWFAFWFCNLIWGVVPYYRIQRAMQECHRAFVQQAASTLSTLKTD
jgi:EXPERA (EXPanded EBP superfamily)